MSANPGVYCHNHIIALGRETDAVVKLSAPYRSSRRAPVYDDLDLFSAELIEAFDVGRCIWGSDWPFLGVARRPTYDQVLAPLPSWLPEEADRRAVLWDNPCRLFGFGGDQA
jgi:predicted TIM-barrel fold metal-dependent hydrolase